MTQVSRLARIAALAAAAACAFVISATCVPSIGEAAKKVSKPAGKSADASDKPADANKPETQEEAEAAQKAKDKEAGRQAYDAGVKAYAAGKYQPAVDQLTSALKAAALSPSEMAKALYLRGASYKKQSKSGLAISDLTAALWLKNGLSPEDRAAASRDRAEAFNMAGLKETSVVREASGPSAADLSAPASSAGLSAAAVAQAAKSSAASPATSSGTWAPDAGASVTRQAPDSPAAQDATQARQVATAPVDANGLQSVASSTVASGGGGQATPSLGFTSTAEAATSAPAPAASTSGSGISGFFSNLFGGGSSTPAPAEAPQQTGLTTTSTTPLTPETSSWSSATTITAPKAGRQVALSVGSTKAATKAASAGKYKIHIAAVRSRAEAEAVAQKLTAEHGADLADHTATVDEAVIGSMGTFYRVRVGGYASQDEPRGVCNKLRTSGLDCLVVTN